MQGLAIAGSLPWASDYLTADDAEELLNRPEWQARAACRDASRIGVDFFARTVAGIEAAKAVCARCPVVDDCRAWALAEDPDLQGVWGGLSDADRQRLRGGPAPARRPPRAPKAAPMGREERIATVAALRAEGRKAPAIAEALGVHRTVVDRDLALISSRSRSGVTSLPRLGGRARSVRE